MMQREKSETALEAKGKTNGEYDKRRRNRGLTVPDKMNLSDYLTWRFIRLRFDERMVVL